MSADVEDFEYTPRPEFEGNFTVFNEPDEVWKLFWHFHCGYYSMSLNRFFSWLWCRILLRIQLHHLDLGDAGDLIDSFISSMCYVILISQMVYKILHHGAALARWCFSKFFDNFPVFLCHPLSIICRISY